jgi:hypothetical protein
MNISIKVNRAKVSSPASPAGWPLPVQFLAETAVRVHIVKVGRPVLAGTFLDLSSECPLAALPLVPDRVGPVRTFISVARNRC